MHNSIAQFLGLKSLTLFRNGCVRMILNAGNNSRSCNRALLLWNQKYFKSTCSEIIGESDILLEDGMDIQELPLIVRKVNGNHISDSPEVVKKKTNITSNKFVNSSQEMEIKEMIEGFDKCYSPKSVFSLLDLIPKLEITPSVALQALKTIVKLENSREFKNKFGAFMADEEPETSINHAVINNLIEVIVTSEENHEILEALQLISEELSGDSLPQLRQKLCDEVLIRIADNKFSISEICSSARSLLLSGNQFDIDKLWVGVIGKQSEITEKNIMEVFRILMHVNLSRSLILKILQKQLEAVSLKLTGENVSEILSILNEINDYPYSIIQCLSNWLNIKILKVNEEDLGGIIEGFMEMPNCEDVVVKAIERFMLLKHRTIKNPELVASIMEYINKYKVRSTVIFTSCSEYFVKNAKNMSPLVLKSIFLPFGNLNFQPPNNDTFWKILEEELMDKFVQLYSEDALDIMLSFIFLEKYPLQFVTKIFNPYFLDRLHSLKDTSQIHLIRTKLKLLDTAMTLECKNYQGPLLLPDLSSSLISQDTRIQKVSDYLLEILPSILEPDKNIASSVVLKNLPLTELYIVDVIVHPKGKPSLLYSTDSWNDFTALLVHIPEHYDSTGKHLVGSQVMRKRHLRSIGLNVVDLDYNKINAMKNEEGELKEYLKNRLSTPEQAFPY